MAYQLSYCKPEEFETFKNGNNVVIEVKMVIGDIQFHDGMVIEDYQDIDYKDLIDDIDSKGNALIQRYSRAISLKGESK